MINVLIILYYGILFSVYVTVTTLDVNDYNKLTDQEKVKGSRKWYKYINKW